MRNARRALVAVFLAACVVVGGLAIYWPCEPVGGRADVTIGVSEPVGEQKAVPIEVGEDSSTEQRSEPLAAEARPIDPLFGVDEVARSFERSLEQNAAARLRYAAFEADLREQRRAGVLMYGAEDWMRPVSYYQQLDTEALAIECFSRSMLEWELGIFDDPTLGYIRVKVMHDGFAELFDRADFWKGLVRAHQMHTDKLQPTQSLQQVVRTAHFFDSMVLLVQVPEIQEKLKGKELELVKVQLQAVEQFIDYIRNFDPAAAGYPTPFYGEPVSLVQASLALASRANAPGAAQAQAHLQQIRFPREQRVADIEQFLVLALESLRPLVDATRQ
jgi:hypothetical protein